MTPFPVAASKYSALHPVERRRPGLAALADLRRARRDLRQPGRHLRAARRWSTSTSARRSKYRTRRPPRLVRGQRRRLAAGRRRRGRPARRPGHRVRRQRLDRLDRPAPHPARGRPGGRVAAGVRRRRAASSARTSGSRRCAASTGTGCSTSTGRWSNGSPPPTSSRTCCARCWASWAPRTRTSPPPAATRARRTTSARMGLLGANFVRRDGELDGPPHPARRLLRLQGPFPAGRHGHPGGRGAHPCRRPPGGPGRRARTRCWRRRAARRSS